MSRNLNRMCTRPSPSLLFSVQGKGSWQGGAAPRPGATSTPHSRVQVTAALRL